MTTTDLTASEAQAQDVCQQCGGKLRDASGAWYQKLSQWGRVMFVCARCKRG